MIEHELKFQEEFYSFLYQLEIFITFLAAAAVILIVPLPKMKHIIMKMWRQNKNNDFSFLEKESPLFLPYFVFTKKKLFLNHSLIIKKQLFSDVGKHALFLGPLVKMKKKKQRKRRHPVSLSLDLIIPTTLPLAAVWLVTMLFFKKLSFSVHSSLGWSSHLHFRDEETDFSGRTSSCP